MATSVTCDLYALWIGAEATFPLNDSVTATFQNFDCA